jgi:hypothetical protein
MESTTYARLANLSPPAKPRLHCACLAHLRAPSRGVYVAEPGAAPAGSFRKRASGTPRVTVRSNYVGPPSMAGRGTDERGRKPPGSGKSPPFPEDTVPRCKVAASERQGARVSLAGRRPTPPQRVCADCASLSARVDWIKGAAWRSVPLFQKRGRQGRAAAGPQFRGR